MRYKTVILVGALLCFSVFYAPVKNAIFQFAVEKSFSLFFGLQLQTGRCVVDGGKFIIEHPVWTSSENKEFRIEAKQIAGSFSAPFKNKRFIEELNVLSPEIKADAFLKNAEAIALKASGLTWLFKRLKTFSVLDGKLIDAFQKPLLFEIEASSSQDFHGKFLGWFEEKSPEDSHFNVAFRRDKKGKHLDVSGSCSVDACLFKELENSRWKFKKGILKADIAFVKPCFKTGVFTGSFCLEDLVLFDEKKQKEIACSAINGLLSKDDFEPLGQTVKACFQLDRQGSTADLFLAFPKSFSDFDLKLAFQNQNLLLKGSAVIQGAFDYKNLCAEWIAKDLALEGKDFVFQAEKAGVLDQAGKGCLFSIKEGLGSKYIPIEKGSYREKSSGFLFEGIAAKVVFKGRQIHLSDASAFCKDLFLQGDVDINLSSDQNGVESVDVFCNGLKGKASDVKQMLSFNIPLEGNLSLGKAGAEIHIDCEGGGKQVQIKAQGRLTDGSFEVKNKTFFQNLHLDFAYDSRLDILELTDLCAPLLQTPGREQDFYLAADRVRLSLAEKQILDFDVWIGNRSKDIIRLAGYTACAKTDHSLKDGQIVFVFDQSRSHVGKSFPERLELSVKDFLTVDRFSFKSTYEAEDVFQAFKGAFAFLKLPSVIKAPLDCANDFKGTLQVLLEYAEDQPALGFEIESKDLVKGSHRFSKWHLLGTTTGASVSVNEMAVDDLSCAADFVFTEQGLCLHFLGGKLPGIGMVGLEGEYDKNSSCFDGKVHLLEVYLPGFEKFRTRQGRFRVNQNNISLQADCQMEEKRFFADLQASLNPFDGLDISLKKDLSSSASLAIHVDFDEENRLFVSRCNGQFSNLEIHLSRHTSQDDSKPHLFGSVYGDVCEMSQWCPGSLKEMLQKTQMQGKAFLKGFFSLPWQACKDFCGIIEAENLGIGGVVYEKVVAKAVYEQDSLKLTDVKAKSLFGSLDAEMIGFKKEPDKPWRFYARSCFLENLQVGKLAFEKKQEKTFPIVFKELDIEEVEGRLFDAESVFGKGSFCFESADLEGYSPKAISGKAYYEIEKRKVVFKKIADLNIQGLAAKLSFLKEDKPSFIDFDGNLHLRFKFKQANGLLKLASPFLFVVDGTLENPVYQIEELAPKKGKVFFSSSERDQACLKIDAPK